MKKILVLLIAIVNYGYSQDIVNHFNLYLESNRDVFQIVNDSTKEVNLFVSDRKKVFSFILNDRLEIKDSISSKRPDKKFKDIIGYSNFEGKNYIYWATKRRDILFAQEFDLNSRKVRGQTIEFPINKLDNEIYLESFISGNKFYILKVDKNSKQLQLHEFVKDSMNSFVIDTSKLKFLLNNNGFASIYKVIFEEINGEISFQNNFDLEKELPRIDTNIPSTLADSAKKIKLYILGKKMYLTFDNSVFKTQILEINLTNKLAQLIEVEKPLVKNTVEEVKSNSFLIDNKLFQIVVSKNELHLALKDLQGNLIREYIIKENDKFNINNTPFVRERISGSERELETTSQFLRKIVRSNVGLAVYKLYDNYLVTLGCVSAEINGGGAPVMGMGGFGMTMGGGTTFFMPSPANFMMMGYFNYKGRRSVSTKCIFNMELAHVPIELKDLAFDKIKKYEDELEMPIESPTIFRWNNDYIYGFYNSSVSNYSFIKFTD